MAATEAKRLDLYNALTEFLGPERADTLMAYLPTHESTQLATKSDIDRLEGRIERLEIAIGAVNRRLDRLFLTLVAGLVAMFATVFAQAIL